MTLVAQVPADFRDNVRTAMAASLGKQKESVRKQVATATVAPDSGFFTVAWPKPVDPVSMTPACDPMPKAQLDTLVDETARKQDVKADLIRAVMGQESGFRPCAVSPKGAQGLMQLMPDTVAQLNVADPFDPGQNVEAGAKLLKQLLTKYKGNVELALGAYNAGAGSVDRARGVPQIPETLNYVSAILAHLPGH